MRITLAILLALGSAACGQQGAPAEDIAKAAEEIVDPGTAEPAPLASGPFAPRDACADIEGASAFRARIAAAVAVRDVDALVALAADDIKLDFGGGGGTAQLRARLEAPAGGLWDGLAELMTLGCAANRQGGITLPWIFEQSLGVGDPGAAMLVTGEAVPLRVAPATDGPAARTISWDVVEVIAAQPEAQVQQVKLADGTTGYVASERLRSLLDYRLIASSRNGRWRITSLIAGD